MGKFIRHGIGALVGSALGTLVAWLASQGIEVRPEDLTIIEASMTNGLTLFVTILGYAAVEKFLKRFPGLDLQGYIDRLWLKKEASVAEAHGPGYVPRV